MKSPRAEYLRAVEELFQHVKCCEACAARCVECIPGMRLADEAVRLSAKIGGAKEAA